MPVSTRFRLLPAAVLVAASYISSCTNNEPAAPGSEHDDSPSIPALLEAVSATELQGTVDSPVYPAPTVRVRDNSGHPVPGITVTFTSYASNSVDGKSLASWTVITGSTGIAAPEAWTLGQHAGSQTLEASILGAHLFDADSGASRVVVFHSVAKPGPAASVLRSYGDKQVGLTNELMEPPSVIVADRFGNRVLAAITVTFTVTAGGGSLDESKREAVSVQTREGFASPNTWALGPHGGINSVVVSVAGLNSVTFTAEALDPGALTHYDLQPNSVRLIKSAGIVLGENGIFELADIETSDAFPGEYYGDRRIGTFTLSGTRILLNYSTGETDEGTLVGDTLSLQYTKLNWLPHIPQEWRFVKRN